MSPATSPGVRSARDVVRVAPGAGHVTAGERRSLTARDVRARARPAPPPADQFSLESQPAVSLGGFPGRGVQLFTYLGGPDPVTWRAPLAACVLYEYMRDQLERSHSAGYTTTGFSSSKSLHTSYIYE